MANTLLSVGEKGQCLLGLVINLCYHLPEAARSAEKACWEKYNSEGTPYGTCDAAKPRPCAKRSDDG